MDCTKLKVEPFNSVKKMSVIVSLPGGGLHAFCKGALEIILQMCDKVVDNDGNITSLSKKDILDVINSFPSEDLRTLCSAYKDIDEANKEDDIPAAGYTLIAVFGIKDPLCPEVKAAVQTCIDVGITVRMVTGDNINIAKVIARECGILTDDGLAIEGPKFCNKSPEEMKELIPKIQEWWKFSDMLLDVRLQLWHLLLSFMLFFMIFYP